MTERGCYYTDECNANYRQSIHNFYGDDMPDDFPGPRNIHYKYETIFHKGYRATRSSPEELPYCEVVLLEPKNLDNKTYDMIVNYLEMQTD